MGKIQYEVRRCFRCKIEKPISEFYRSNVRYYQRECKDCTKARRDAWWKTDEGKESARKSKLKARFGITAEKYDEMLTEQQGKCAICGEATSCMGHRLAVDHDHETNEIRGLLCKACNVAIGNLRENPTLCRLAAEYLEKHA